MESRRARQQFLDFFQSKGHEIVPSAPLINRDDPTLMFINAGMNPFKDIFTGHKNPTHLRVADSQKCLRVSGKHNDLEEVGRDTYHHTFFEMLGNWSFGDYFRDEAIDWAWELLVEVFGIDSTDLFATYFGGEEKEDLAADDESKERWLNYLPADRILPCSKKDNFWEMGETGPCGPCTEIHIDLRSKEEKSKTPGWELVNKDHPQVVEIWNLVFIQFNRKADQSLETLKMKSVDTGMGFERLCMVLQGKQSNYDTDVFAPLLKHLEQSLGVRYDSDEATRIAMRVAADHVRAVAFTIADGQLPSNTGAGYVIRRLIRRASRYGYKYLRAEKPFLAEMVAVLAEQMGEFYPELKKQQALITQILEQEEKNFIEKLKWGTTKFEDYIAQKSGADKHIEGSFAFELYDTFGFPFDLTQMMAEEAGWQVDTVGFEQAMKEQRERSRNAAEKAAGDWVLVDEKADLPVFIGYDALESTVHITRYRTLVRGKAQEHYITLDQSPFYAESGGQIGDTGTLDNGEERVEVLDCTRENELIVLKVNRLPQKASGDWLAQVDSERRRQIRAHHSATHLLHAALRQVLGTHVEQRGSLVARDYLRFDFSHFQKPTDEELKQIEYLVNQQIVAALPLEELRDVPIEEAKGMGAMALFGEKYGNSVRVIRFGGAFSTELCGGTHAQNTLEIRHFKITSESSTAAGIRRIEALASDAVILYLEKEAATLAGVRQHFPPQQTITEAVEKLILEKKELEKKLSTLRNQQLMQLRDQLLLEAKPGKDSGQVLVSRVEIETGDEMKQLAFELRKNSRQTRFVIGALINGKPLLAVVFSEDYPIDTQPDAKLLVNQFAKVIQGGGGGQPFFATAGGKKPEALDDALKAAWTELIG